MAVFILSVPFVLADTPPREWFATELAVRDCKMPKEESQKKLSELRPLLDKYFIDNGGTIAAYTPVFPLEGYDVYDADTKGYIVNGYDFFDGNQHKDHPAVDIFIRDRNQDCLDDRTGKLVKIFSVSPGVVTGINTGWTPGSPLRGGNYVFVYDPFTKGLFYYAHMSYTAVDVGQVVKPGDLLGTVGRTGLNAYKKKSPTHTHLMYLKYHENGYPMPEKAAKFLYAAHRHREIPGPESLALIASQILKGAKNEAAAGKNYKTNYPEPEAGTAVFHGADAVFEAFLFAGIDLKALISEDMRQNITVYPGRIMWDKIKADPDFIEGQYNDITIFFDRFAEELTLRTDILSLHQWAPGDVVIWSYKNAYHAGIISDRKDGAGTPYVIHSYPGYTAEEDVLNTWKIIRHYRYGG